MLILYLARKIHRKVFVGFILEWTKGQGWSKKGQCVCNVQKCLLNYLERGNKGVHFGENGRRVPSYMYARTPAQKHLC